MSSNEKRNDTSNQFYFKKIENTLGGLADAAAVGGAFGSTAGFAIGDVALKRNGSDYVSILIELLGN